jgi:uncharacterized protein involved in exopolysaccharide biosynthesis
VAEPETKPQRPPAAQPAIDDEIDLLDYLHVLWRYRWMIAVLCVVALGLAVAVSLLQPRQYQAAVTVVPPLDLLQKQSAGGLGGLDNPLLRQMIGTATDTVSKMYVEILESREVADTLIDRFHLMDVYERVKYRADARRQLQKNTKIETTDGGAVKVTVLDRDPNRVAALANAYIDELDKQNKRLSTGQATSNRIFLENRLKEVEARLSKIDKIPTREAQAQERVYDVLLQQCEMAKIEEAKSMPTIQILDPPIVPERGVPRGTVKKGILAGIAAFMLGVFVAFAREYVLQARQRGTATAASPKRGAQAPASYTPA